MTRVILVFANVERTAVLLNVANHFVFDSPL